MTMLACKPTTIEPFLCQTEWFGCPVGTGGRPVPVFGIVLHVVPEGQMDDVTANMGQCLTPKPIPNDSYSYHYTVPNDGLIYEHVDPDDVAWAAGFYCNFSSYPTITPSVTPGWPIHPSGSHIAESSIHIGVPQYMQDLPYQQLIRLMSYLHYRYGIPFDTGHMTQMSSIFQGGYINSPQLFNVHTDAAAYCERCCDILEYDNDEPLHSVNGFDQYGCPTFNAASEIFCAAVVDEGDEFDIDNDKMMVNNAENCMEAVTVTRALVFGYVCSQIISINRTLNLNTDKFLVQTAANCMEAVSLNRQDIFDIVCDFISDTSRLYDIDTDSLLVQTGDECMEAVNLTRELIFGYVCDQVVSSGRDLNLNSDKFLVQSATNCMEAVSLNRQDIFDIVCDFIEDGNRTFDIDRDALLVQTNSECMETVELTRALVFEYVCSQIVSNGRALDLENDLFLVQSAFNCMETVSLNGQDIFDIVCDFIEDDDRTFDIDRDTLLVQTNSECMEAVELTRALVFGYVCSQIVDNNRTFDIDRDTLLVQTNSECMEAVGLTRALVFEYICSQIVDNSAPLDIDNHSLLVQTSANCMEAVSMGIADTSCIDLSFNSGVLTASPILAPTYGEMPDGCNGLVCGPDGLSAPACVENVMICPDLTQYNLFHTDVPEGFFSTDVANGKESIPFSFTNDSCYKWIVHLQCLSTFDVAVEAGSGVNAWFDVSVDNGVTWRPYSILWQKGYQTYEADAVDPSVEVWHDRQWHRYSETQTVCHVMDPGDTFTVITRVRLGGIGGAPLAVNRIATCIGFHRAVVETIATCPE